MNLICFLVFAPFGLVAMICSFSAMIFWLVAHFLKWISDNLVVAADCVAECGFSLTSCLVDIFDKKE